MADDTDRREFALPLRIDYRGPYHDRLTFVDARNCAVPFNDVLALVNASAPGPTVSVRREDDPALVKRIARVIADAEGIHIGEAADFGEWHAEEFEDHAVAVLRALSTPKQEKSWDAATVNECARIVEYIAEHAASDGDSAYFSDKGLSVAAYNLRDLLKMAANAMRAELSIAPVPDGAKMQAEFAPPYPYQQDTGMVTTDPAPHAARAAVITGKEIKVGYAAAPIPASPPAQGEAAQIWASMERLLIEECALLEDQGLASQRSNLITMMANHLPDREAMAAAVEFLGSPAALHKIRVHGKLVTREKLAAILRSAT